MSDGISTEGQGQGPATEPAAPAAPAPGATPEVQPPAGDGAQPGQGQDFIAPYLEGVDGPVRDVVAEKLEAYRRDSDANFTRRFQQAQDQLSRYSEVGDPDFVHQAARLYDALIDQPLETIPWIVERLASEGGRDIRADLLQRLQTATQDPAPQGQGAQEEDRPLTRRELEEWHRQQQAEQQRAQQTQQATATINQWFDEAASKMGISIAPDDPMRFAVFTHAKTLMPQAQGDGRLAVQMALEAVRNGLAPQAPPTTDPTPDPKVASGGSGGPARSESPPDWSDPKARREHMLAHLQTGT